VQKQHSVKTFAEAESKRCRAGNRACTEAERRQGIVPHECTSVKRQAKVADRWLILVLYSFAQLLSVLFLHTPPG